MPTIDEISPAYVGEERIALSLDSSTATPLALLPVQVNADYSATKPEGVAPPLELIVNGPTYLRRVFRNVAPSSFTFVPEASGQHLVLVRELAHNRWVGLLLVDVRGDDLQTTRAN